MNTSCKECSAKLIGRIDKKFCNDYCRTSYHSRMNRAENNTIRNINAALKRNRRILANYLQEQGKRISRESLLLRNFNFLYTTHYQIDQSNKVIPYVYEFGLLPKEEEFFEIKKMQCSSEFSFQSMEERGPFPTT